MQPILQDFTIGFFDSSGVFSVYAKKDDVGRGLKFHIYDNLHDYSELLSDVQLSISLRVVLPSGFNLPDIPVDKSGVDISEQSVIVPITAEMVQQVGTARCEVVFATGLDHIISTTHFKLIVVDSFNRIEPETEVMFNTWTEYYIKLDTLYNTITTDEARRVENENTRISNENIRIANENTRIEHENTRIASETTRESNESARVSAETARDTAEQQREAAERVRESRVQEQVDEAHMWANGMATGLDTPSATNNAEYYAKKAQGISGIFNGTKAEWDNLPISERVKFFTVIIVDD